MKAESKNPKKTTKSTKNTPTKKTSNKSVKNNRGTKTTSNTKKGGTVKKTTTTKKVEKKEAVKTVKPVENVEVVEVKSTKNTKNVKKCNFITKIKNIILKNWEEKREFSIACIIIAVLVVMIILLALSKQVPKLKNGKEVIASIDGLKVTSEDLYQNLKTDHGTTELINMVDEYIADDYVKEFTEEDEKYIDEVVDYYKQYADYYGTSFEDFLSQYVGISGVSTEDEFREYVKKDYKKTLAVQKYVGSTISDEELKQEFNENYKEKLTVRHILIEVKDDVTEEDAKKEAEELIKKLDEVKDDADKLEEKFKDLAYDNSADTATYEDGGLFKDFSKNGTDENFYKASKELKNGEYTAEPVKSQYGYHVILKVSSKTNKYKDVKEEIKTALAKEMLSADTTLQVTAMDELRQKYNLKINDSETKKAYKKTISDAVKKANTSTEESTESTTDTSESTDETEEETSSEE